MTFTKLACHTVETENYENRSYKDENQAKPRNKAIGIQIVRTQRKKTFTSGNVRLNRRT